MTRRLPLALAVLAGLATAPAARAERVVEEVQAGPVSAALSYERTGERFADFRIRITRAGQPLVDQPVEPRCGFCFPANRAADDKSIAAPDLDRDGEPEVIADIYTGGAHCCTLSTLYGFLPAAGAYKRIRRNWLDAGYRLRDLDRNGVVELWSADARFAYAFASYAESYLPLQIWRYSAGGLADVTRRFRRHLRADARQAYRLYRRYRRARDVNVRGFLAGYVADKYRLGQRRSAERALRRARRRGDVDRRYVSRLRRFLRRLGYNR